MRVLWLCNVAVSSIAREIGLKEQVSGGWLEGAYKGIKNCDIELGISFPSKINRDYIIGNAGKTRYYLYNYVFKNISNYKNWEVLRIFIDDFKPDLVHIWGTETIQSLAMVKLFCSPSRTVISIQGLVGVYAKHYFADLPYKYRYAITIHDFFKGGSLYAQQKVFEKQGKLEKEAICSVNNIIGRTEWDKACTNFINNSASYFKCNETLRSEFYDGKVWSIDSAEKYSIFVTQWRYPIKGFHYLLQAMPNILKIYPDAHIYTTGTDPKKLPFYRVTAYIKYIMRLIKEYLLEDKITFCGVLSGSQIKDQLLRCNVFVIPSIIENSPNSLGEAMILGVPAVAADVGGVKDQISHGDNGFIYPHDEPYMISYYVNRLFGDDKLCSNISSSGRKSALAIYNPQRNANQLYNIYANILNTTGHNISVVEIDKNKYQPDILYNRNNDL